MNDSGFIIFNERGIVRLTKRKPPLAKGEYMCVLNFVVPDSFFESSIPEFVLEYPANGAQQSGIEVKAVTIDNYDATFGSQSPKKTGKP